MRPWLSKLRNDRAYGTVKKRNLTDSGSSKLGTSFLSAAHILIPNSLHSLFTSSFRTHSGSFISPSFLECREDQKNCYDITRLLISNVSDYCLQNGTHKLPAERLVLVFKPVSYTHLRAHETRHDLVCRLL